jgi:hypothetical protein
LLAFTIGKSDLGSKRLAKKMIFTKSPSKISGKRKAELLKVSKVAALKALSCICAKPENVFDMLCQEEISKKKDGGSPFSYSSEVKSLRLAFEKSSTPLQRKRILSIIALSFSLPKIRKMLGLSISRFMYSEARMSKNMKLNHFFLAQIAWLLRTC